MGQTWINIVHRADPGARELEGLRFQQDIAHRHGFKTTLLMTYSGFQDASVVAYVKEQHETHGDEVGLHFHSLLCDDYRERFKTEARHFYLLPFALKCAIVDRLMVLFHEHFGFAPAAIGSYVLDAQTINYIRKTYPTVGVGIVNCFEEGIKMFEGNDHGWFLFSDGGPWGPYRVSTDNQLCPAAGADDDSGLIGLPHLNRDMLLSIASRDDYFASHPLNLSRARITEGGDCAYMYRFIDQWMEQATYNDYGYYNVFVSIPWILEGFSFTPSQAEARSLYDKNLGYLRKKIDEGVALAATMSEFAAWYRKHREKKSAEVVLWRDILCGSKRQLFWYADPAFRLTIDPNAGGAICDLRPYVGRVDRNLGPDRPNRWDGSYPHLINTENLGGPGATSQSAAITVRGKTAMLYDRRASCEVEKTAAGHWTVRLAPIRLTVGDARVTIESVYTFAGGGRVRVERRILESSAAGDEIMVAEVHRGCWGSTIYPGDLRGTLLAIGKGNGHEGARIAYEYLDRGASEERAAWVEARLPMGRCRVRLVAEGQSLRGRIAEGHLFKPFYTLELAAKLKAGETLATSLEVHAL